ncbi:MAG: hypothetical protein P8Y44_14085 [Acidobacteriota bacterium]
MITSHHTIRIGILAVALLITASISLAPEVAEAGEVDVQLRLPVRARLNLEDRKTVTVTPFIVVSDEGEESAIHRGVDIQKEFERYLKRLIRRNTQLKIIDSGPVDYPSYDLLDLTGNTEFWKYLGERTQSDLIVTGSLDFDIQDRSGYRTEEYVSPFDSRTYYRQVLVESTGYEYDIVMQVFDGRTGEQLYSDNFKDFRQFEADRADPLAGMFENLYALEDRIAGIFTQKWVVAERVLYTQ